MATPAETRVVNAAGAAQGIVLVTFPAARTIFTSASEYDLSNTQYGVLFLPQVATAITASLLGAWLGKRFGTKRVYVAGLAGASWRCCCSSRARSSKTIRRSRSRSCSWRPPSWASASA